MKSEQEISDVCLLLEMGYSRMCHPDYSDNFSGRELDMVESAIDLLRWVLGREGPDGKISKLLESLKGDEYLKMGDW